MRSARSPRGRSPSPQGAESGAMTAPTRPLPPGLAALEGLFLVSLPPRGRADRAKQKRTVADLRGAMTAVEAIAAKEGRLPEASSMNDLAKLLEPAYVPRLPRADAWGTRFATRLGT